MAESSQLANTALIVSGAAITVDGSKNPIHLTAQWELNSYFVTYNSNGGSPVATASVDYNTTVSAPAAPTKTGHTFDGWFKETGLTNTWNFDTDVVTGNITLYAKYTLNTYEGMRAVSLSYSFGTPEVRTGGSLVTVPFTSNYGTFSPGPDAAFSFTPGHDFATGITIEVPVTVTQVCDTGPALTTSFTVFIRPDRG